MPAIVRTRVVTSRGSTPLSKLATAIRRISGTVDSGDKSCTSTIPSIDLTAESTASCASGGTFAAILKTTVCAPIARLTDSCRQRAADVGLIDRPLRRLSRFGHACWKDGRRLPLTDIELIQGRRCDHYLPSRAPQLTSRVAPPLMFHLRLHNSKGEVAVTRAAVCHRR
jgi:hypothetical protein